MIVPSAMYSPQAVQEKAVIGTPHERYRRLVSDKPVVDIWGITGNGVRV